MSLHVAVSSEVLAEVVQSIGAGDAQIPGALNDTRFAKVGNPALEPIALEKIVLPPFAEPQNRDTGFNSSKFQIRAKHCLAIAYALPTIVDR